MDLGCLASTSTEKTEALNLSGGPAGFPAEWIVTVGSVYSWGPPPPPGGGVGIE
jgi:hypothetical protein